MTAYSNRATKKPTRKRGPRRQWPTGQELANLYIADSDAPTDLDVTLGRGGGSNHHEGNKRYWRRILVERPLYKVLGKNENAEKNAIAGAIYGYIISSGGRFLKLADSELDPKLADDTKWFVVPEKIALDKIKQALRDKYVPHFAKQEPQSPIMAPLSTPRNGTTLEDRKGFLNFLNKKSSAPKSNFFNTNAPSIDIDAVFAQQGSLDKLDFHTKDFAPLQQSLSDFLSKPSKNTLDLPSTLGHDLKSGDEWSNFPTRNESTLKSFEFSLRGHSLDNLMCGDLIATVDNMNETSKAYSAVPEAPKSLQAVLQLQMEAAIPSSRRTFVAAV